MKIEKPHPHWPDERDFDCPKCGGPLADKTERDHCDCEETETVTCPHCGEKLIVEMTFRIEYKVTSNAELAPKPVYIPTPRQFYT